LQLDIAIKLAECIKDLHSCGIIHCDISPASVARSAAGDLKIADFHSAHLCPPPPPDAAGPSSSALISAPVATFPTRRVSYLAPEQLIQAAYKVLGTGASGDLLPGRVTDRTDIWAFGVTMLHLWTGLPPKRGETPDFWGTDLPEILKDLFLGCLQGDFSRRPSAANVLEQLQLVQAVQGDIPEFGGGEGDEKVVGVPRGLSLRRSLPDPPPAPPQEGPAAAVAVHVAAGGAKAVQEDVDDPPVRRQRGATLLICETLLECRHL
jgi:serine/threonine protein kinase